MRVNLRRDGDDTLVRVTLEPPSNSLAELLYDVVRDTGGDLELDSKGVGLLRLPEGEVSRILIHIEAALNEASVNVSLGDL